MKKEHKEKKLDVRYKTLVLKKNKKNINKFYSVPFSERIILLPQCLRNIKKCIAKDIGNRYVCQKCGSCKIYHIINSAEELRYKGAFILKGGRAIIDIIKQFKPKSILGIACFYEGLLGIQECEKNRIPVQFVPLTKDGCFNTDVNLRKLMLILYKRFNNI